MASKKQSDAMDGITINPNLIRNIIYLMPNGTLGFFRALSPKYESGSKTLLNYYLNPDDYPIKDVERYTPEELGEIIESGKFSDEELGVGDIMPNRKILEQTAEALSDLANQALLRFASLLAPAPAQQTPVQEKAQVVNNLLDRLAKVENFNFDEIKKKSSEVAKSIADLQRMQNALEQVESRLSEIRQSFQQQHEQNSL